MGFCSGNPSHAAVCHLQPASCTSQHGSVHAFIGKPHPRLQNVTASPGTPSDLQPFWGAAAPSWHHAPSLPQLGAVQLARRSSAHPSSFPKHAPCSWLIINQRCCLCCAVSSRQEGSHGFLMLLQLICPMLKAVVD